jgi:periplasmic protein TonB
VSGTLAGPAPIAAGGAIRLSRLWIAVAVALAMHVAILAARPGGVTGSHVAPAAKAMAIRVLHAPAAAEPSASDRTPPGAAVAEAVLPARAAVPEPRAATRIERAPVRHAPEPPAARQAAVGSERSDRVAATRMAAPAAMPSTAATALPAAPDYALGIRLDPGPRPLDDIEPEYPDPHLREGTVVLRLLISETGHVDNVAVVRSEPIGVFEQAALDAFGKARFAPGLAAGTPVKSQITVEVRFVPINRGARVSGRTY